MPADGIYLSNDAYAKLQGDLFEQDARGTIADEWHRQVTAALPDMVAQAQQDEAQRQAAIDQQRQQAEQAQRDALADQFEAAAPQIATDHVASLVSADPDLATRLGGAPAPESLQNGPTATLQSQPAQTTTADLNAAPAPAAPEIKPLSPVTASLVNPPTATQQPIAPVQSATQTTAALSGGGDLAGQVGARGQQIMASAADSASWLGQDGQRALQAVLLTEGGLAGARGDQGKSAGPLQFFEGGQLANFAQQHGLSLDQAKAYVEANPEEAVRWAIGTPDAPGYLGRAIQAGLQAGLKGADLATYAQQHGQVSVSPERAGANYNALFGGGAPPIVAAGQAAFQQAARDPNSILNAVKPFLGSSYVWGGKSATTGFDCSGLAGYLTTGQPESTGTLYGKSSAVTPDTAQPGDLVFWNMGSNDPHLQHVGVYLGNGQVVQSGGDQAKVNIGSINQSIGSPPEFRRLGPGGAPAQAVAAPPGAPSPAEPPAAAPGQPQQSMWDKLGTGISDVFKNIFGGAGGQAPQTGIPAVDALTGGINLTDPTRSAIGNNPVAPAGSVPTTGQLAGTALMSPTVQDVAFNGPAQQTLGAMQAATGVVGGAISDLGQTGVGRFKAENFPSILDPNHPANVLTDPNATDEQRQNALFAVVAGIEGGGISGAETMGLLAKAEQAVAELRARFPQMSEGSLAASGAGQQLAALREAAAQAPVPTLGSEVSSTLPPGSGPLAPAVEPLESDVTLQGLRNMVAARAQGEAPAPAADLLGLKTDAPVATNGHLPSPVDSPVASAAATPQAVAPSPGEATAAPVRPLSLTPASMEPPTPPPPARPTTNGAVPPPPSGPLVQGELPGIPPPTPGKASLADVFRAYHTGNVVSGLATLTHVAVNSILAPAWSFVTRGAADVAGLNFDRLAGSGIGAGAGLADSGRAIAQAFADHFSNPEAIFNKTLPGPLNSGVAKLFLRAQAVPTALHAMGQSFAQNTIMKMEVGRLAGEEATRLGLTGQAWSNHIANAINNPTGPLAQQAEALAKRAALRGDPGTVGQIMSKVASVPYVGNTLFPVVRIASNALTQGIEKSPIGLLGTGLDVARAVGKSGPYAKGFAGNGIVAPLQERLTNNLAGTALTAWLATKALDGSITGDGPGDPGQKAELMAQGWQPNSVYVPGRGYLDFHVFGPLADSFALAGSYGDAVKYGGNKGGTTNDPGTIAESMFKQMGKYLEDSTGMRTIGQLYDIFHTQGVGLNQAAKAAAQFGSSMVGGFVPFSALDRGIATATDPYARKAVASAGDLPSLAGQDLSMGIPGLREANVPIKQDVLGRPEANNQTGLSVFSPRTGTGTPDPVIKAIEDAGVRFPPLPKQVPVSSKYAVDLTPDEQQQFQSLRGQLVQQMVGELVADPDFAVVPLATRQKYIQQAFARADKAASQQLISQIPDSELIDRAMANQERRAPVAFASP